MATDNRTEHSLFPDVTEHYERETASRESAPQQSPPGPPVEPTPVPVPRPPVEQQTSIPVPGPPVESISAPIPEPAREAPLGDLPADVDYPKPELSQDSESDLPDEFDQMPTWLVAPDSPAPERKKREKREKREKRQKRDKREKQEKQEKRDKLEQPEQPEKQEKRDKPEKPQKLEKPAKQETREEETSGGRKPLLIGGVAVALLAIASAATVVVLRSGDTATEGTPKPVAAAAATTSGTSAASATPESAAPAPAWCAESAADGRSVGRGPGGTSDGPGVIRAFDHAYYVERNGARVASLMVAPNAVPEIQKWIDEVSLGTEHCVTIASTPDPNVFNVDLGLRTPGSSDGVIRQRITVAPSPEGFKIAKVEDTK